MSARRRPAAAALVTVVFGLVLAALALAASHVALGRAVPPLVTFLLASASVAAFVAGAGFAWACAREIHAALDSGETRKLAMRLPGNVVRVVLVVGATLSAAGLVVAATRGVPASALGAGAVAVGATLATLAAASTMAAQDVARRLLARAAGSAAVEGGAPGGRRASLRARLGAVGLALAAGAGAPAAALALSAGAPAPVALAALAWLLVLAAGASSTIGDAAAAAASDAAGALARLGADARPQPPGETIAPLAEARRVEDAAAAVAERLHGLRAVRREALARALEADRLRTQFLANVSHELRSPLHAILGFADLLLRGVDGELNADQRKSIERIRDSGTHLLHIIQEVLDLARLDAGKLELVRAPTIVAELIEQSVEEIRGRFPQLVLDVSTRLERALPNVTVDPFRLVQALAYLITYTVEATTGGTQRKRVRLLLSGRMRGGDEARAVEIVVAAPDAIISDDEHAHLFDGFRGLSGKSSGLGLGPHLARRLVELHGGRVLLGPASQGVRFEVLLPVP